MTRRQALAVLTSIPLLAPNASANEAPVQLATSWPPGRSPQGFWVSEKFDGVRAVWDGQVLRFRSGRVLSAPAWFVAALPSMPLDGELWMGRGQFDRLSGVVRKAVPDDEAWRAVKYLVFDVPGHAAPFKDRVRLVQTTVQAARVPWLVSVTQEAVQDAPALQSLLQQTVRDGGEGLVLHRTDAHWRSGRTEALYKLKPEPDEEGRVVGYQPGKGRLQGQTGALLVQMPSGQRFALGAGLSDALRRDPPPVGVWVTYRYRDRTPSGLPRFASFVRVREAE
ncbi:DNA ligase [Limnohabitans parvus II-B4]|uniref:DNA ligase n=2 Tax=Limnohabitans TaxID=665874 RepID=A0A315E715_9BURK|nr:DNA ligase [Limnohabitans parvus II-B4]